VFIVDEIAFFITTCKYLIAILVSTIENNKNQGMTDEQVADYDTLGSMLIGLDVVMMSLSVVVAVVIVRVLHTHIKHLSEVESGKISNHMPKRSRSHSTLSAITSRGSNTMHKIAPIILRKQKKKLTRAHLKKAISINRLMNHKNAARTSKDVQIKHERTKAAVLAGMLKKQQSSHERLANRLRKRSSSANMKVPEKTLTVEKIKSEAVVKVRVEERVPDMFYLGDVVWFQRSKKPKRAEIVEVVPIDPILGVTNAGSVQGYMISFLSLKKASKIKFTLPEYISLEEVEVMKEVKKVMEVKDNFNLTPSIQQDDANDPSVVSEEKNTASRMDSRVKKSKLVIPDSDSD